MATNYEFPSRVAKDPTLDVLVKDGVGYIYALNDTAHTTPLAITDRYGSAKANVRTTFDGVTEEFFCQDNAIVWWVSGPYAFMIVSFTGLKNAAEAAAAAAAASQQSSLDSATSAQQAAATASGVSDASMRDLINNAASLTRQALESVVPVIAAKVTTVDTQEPKKIIALANGTVIAIPRTAVAPAQPGAPAVISGAAIVRISWTAVPGTALYALYRDGLEITRTAATSFLDTTGVTNTTYSYTVAAFDAYGQRSPVSNWTNGKFDPALNVAPTVEVRTWPTTIPPSGNVLVRVNARDADAQSVAMALSCDVGSLRPTQDPSVWLYTI